MLGTKTSVQFSPAKTVNIGARWVQEMEYLRGPATLKMRPYLDSAISKLSTMLFLVLCVSTRSS